jgi:hypothetical protein
VIRHQLAVLVRTRAALAPAAAFLFVLLGVYAYRGSGVGSTYAFTALLLCPVMAWLAAAAAFAEPLTQQQVAMAAAGGPRCALRGRVLALAAVGAGLAFVDVAFPALFDLFDRTPGLADLGASASGCSWRRRPRGVRTRRSWSSSSTPCSPCRSTTWRPCFRPSPGWPPP